MSDLRPAEECYSTGKIKVTSLEIVVRGTLDRPYFLIKYKKVGDNHYTEGFGSYILSYVQDWREKCFKLIKEEK